MRDCQGPAQHDTTHMDMHLYILYACYMHVNDHIHGENEWNKIIINLIHLNSMERPSEWKTWHPTGVVGYGWMPLGVQCTAENQRPGTQWYAAGSWGSPLCNAPARFKMQIGSNWGNSDHLLPALALRCLISITVSHWFPWRGNDHAIGVVLTWHHNIKAIW